MEDSGRTRPVEIADLKELRQRALAALRELLGRLSQRTLLVLFIDDLHWGRGRQRRPARGSAASPSSTASSPDRVLSHGGCRSTSPLLLALLKCVSTAGSAIGVTELSLEGLTQAESEHLAQEISGGPGNLEPARAGAIARDTAGNPLFITALVRAAEVVTQATSLDSVIQARVARLGEPARQLLEVVAVARQPIALELAKQAARHQGADYEVMTALRGGHLELKLGRREAARKSRPITIAFAKR